MRQTDSELVVQLAPPQQRQLANKGRVACGIFAKQCLHGVSMLTENCSLFGIENLSLWLGAAVVSRPPQRPPGVRFNELPWESCRSVSCSRGVLVTLVRT